MTHLLIGYHDLCVHRFGRTHYRLRCLVNVSTYSTTTFQIRIVTPTPLCSLSRPDCHCHINRLRCPLVDPQLTQRFKALDCVTYFHVKYVQQLAQTFCLTSSGRLQVSHGHSFITMSSQNIAHSYISMQYYTHYKCAFSYFLPLFGASWHYLCSPFWIHSASPPFGTIVPLPHLHDRPSIELLLLQPIAKRAVNPVPTT